MRNPGRNQQKSINAAYVGNYDDVSWGNARKTMRVQGDAQQEVGVATEMRLLSVNDAEEVFQVALLIHTHYRHSSVQPDPSAADEFIRVDDYDGYYPDIVMVNCVATQFEEFVPVTRLNKHTGDVWTSFYNTCTISESLELEKFPFDRQLFRVMFKSASAKLRAWKLSVDILDFPPSWDATLRKEVENTASYLVACELKHWVMTDFRVRYYPNDDDPASLTKKEFEIEIRAERDPIFFLYNYFFVIFLIILTNVSVAAIDPVEAGDRTAVTLTLVLTLVAFKFVLLEGTPKVGYLTYMDKYVVTSLIFILIAVFENIFVSPLVLCYFEGELNCVLDEEFIDTARRADVAFQLVFGGVWILINIAVTFATVHPDLVRDSWETVVSGQIGETDKTVKRTSYLEKGE